MSVVKRIIRDNIEYVAVDELLADEYDQAGYGGITLTKTPLGTQINLYAMRPGRVIGKRGRAIKDASERLEEELGIANPQITVIEVEVPELNPQIMAARIANALERGVHYRRSMFWSLNRTMESGALGCEIIIKGPLRSNRGRFEKVSEGYIPKSGDPALKYVKKATVHVKMKKGTFGVNVIIVPPEAKFPDKINLDYLPVIEYPEEEEIPLPVGIEPDLPDSEANISNPDIEQKTSSSTVVETSNESISKPEEKLVDEPVLSELKTESEVKTKVEATKSLQKESITEVSSVAEADKIKTQKKEKESDTPINNGKLVESEEEE